MRGAWSSWGPPSSRPICPVGPQPNVFVPPADKGTTKTMRSARAFAPIAFLVFFAGCLSVPPEDTDGALPTRPTESATGGSGLPTRPSGPTQTSPGSTAAAPAPEPLTDFEDALAGTWRRYHVKNKGYSSEYSYYEYVDFNENRSACRWKYGEESSTSSTDRVFDESDYASWRISQELTGGARYKVFVEGSGLEYVFDFGRNIVYPYGFDTLVFTPNTDGKSCVARDGPSY